jgi:hypothetical protein
MTKLPPRRKSKQAALLALVAGWLRKHQTEEELRVRRCFATEPDSWRLAERTVR